MRTTRIITIVCWGVAALALAALAIWFLTGSVFGIGTGNGFFSFGIGSFEVGTGPFEVVGTYNIPIDRADSLHIDWVSGDVRVEPYDGLEIQLTEYAQRELKDGEKLSVQTGDRTITVKFTSSNTTWRMPPKKLEVLVPRTLCDNMDDLDIDTTSGSITASDINARTVKTDSVSGSVNLSDITSRTLSSGTTSGSITMSAIEADDITLGSTSGTLRLSDATAKTLNCDTTSGSQDLSGSFGSVEIDSISGSLTLNNESRDSTLDTDTTSGSQNLTGSFRTADLNSISGRITLTSTIVPSELETDTTSGAVTITIPNEGEITVYHSATSGSFSSEVPVIMQSGGARFRFSSTSGSVKILALS